MFRDRADAGRRLAEALAQAPLIPDVVLGIPRGGVVVAREVARACGAALDVVVPRKLGAPGNPELAIGAVAPGVQVIDEALVRRLRVPLDYLEREVAAQLGEIERRLASYRGERASPDLKGRAVLVVDDGVATGSTAVAALRYVKAQGASPTYFAAPVGPRGAVSLVSAYCDDCLILETPAYFGAVGEWYERFAQVSDDEVRQILNDIPDGA
jgi:putative phosphoribosyl transferase